MHEFPLDYKNVLIVDDDPGILLVLAHELNKKNANIITAANGLEALEKLNEMEHIDIVLMDIMMPKMNGYEAMAEIRKQKKFKSLPVIALTAKTAVGEQERCLAMGASDYLTKPINKTELVVVMQRWLAWDFPVFAPIYRSA